MLRPADPASPADFGTPGGGGNGLTRALGSLLGLTGLAALLIVTLSIPGATRMHAWPWSLGYAVALIVPAFQLLLRAFNRRRPLALPSIGWCMALLAAFAGIIASALASPHRGASVLWSAPLLAGIVFFFVAFDWLYAEPATVARRRERLLAGAGIFFAAVACVSMASWLVQLPGWTGGNILAARNPHPLGHSNYTAGLALLMLPCFVALALKSDGARQAAWWFAGVLALAMLLTSGSRGGFLGLAVLAVLEIRTIARVFRVRWPVVFLAGTIVLAAIVYWHPRARAALTGDELRISDVQRVAMAKAGWHMGADRPLLGWGPGTTPLVYPRYRAMLEGGAETVLQLHSTPVQIWAELGGVTALAAVALLLLGLRAARTSGASLQGLLALGGYAVFSATDWQLDVPVFAGALAIALALVAPPAPSAASEPRVVPLLTMAGRVFSVRWKEDYPALRRLLGFMTLLALTVLGIFARRDPTPLFNTRALALARDPAQVTTAADLLRQSLKLNPDQEIAHFNLGWLLVVTDPIAAEQHFLSAALLVPDKGGVYFGLGLARLNQGRRDEAERAFALECLSDPVFLVSPWWQSAGVRESRTNTLARLVQLHLLVHEALPPQSPLRAQSRYARELAVWLGSGAAVEHPDTAERAAFFAKKPAPPPFDSASIVSYRRERTGYPVLMRNLDLPVPIDLFDVQENALATGEYRFLFPAKGWLASPLLPALLVQGESRP